MKKMIGKDIFKTKRRNDKERKNNKSQIVSNGNEIKINQQPAELCEAEKYEKLSQEPLEKENEGETCAWIRPQHASSIAGQTPKTCIALGHVYRKEDEKEAAICCYEKALEIVRKQDHFYKTEALRGLGHTYREADENEKAICCYEKALSLAQAGNNRTQETEVFLGLAHAYENNEQHEIAIEKYTKAKEIAKKHNCKWEETEACRGLGKAFRGLGDIKNAEQYFQEALDIAPKESYKENKPLIYLGLAHTYRSNGEYEKAIGSYKEAEKLLAKKSDGVLEEMSAYLGLGHCLKKIGHLKEGEEYLEKAEKTAEKKWDILPSVLRVMNHPSLSENTTIDQTLKEQEIIKEKENEKEEENLKEKNVKEEEDIVKEKENVTEDEDEIKEEIIELIEDEKKEEIIELIEDEKKEEIIELIEDEKKEEIIELIEDEKKEEIVEGEKNIKEDESIKEEDSFQQNTFPLNGLEKSDCKENIRSLAEGSSEVPNPSPMPEDVYHNHDKFVEKTPPRTVLAKKIPDVYTYQASIEEGLTAEIITNMAKEVKKSAYLNLLNDATFSGDDGPIYQMAKKCVCKNDPTSRPGLISNLLARFNRSIGRITCGNAQGTCFIVAKNVVITCHHVYLDFIKQRKETKQPTLPIQVAFDCYELKDLDNNNVFVRVDDSYNPIYSAGLDYILLYLEQSKHLKNRETLGEFVRGYHLHEGLVCISGFPEQRQLMEETCVVVEADAEERLEQRQVQMNGGVHMTKIRAFFEKYPQRLAYDTSLYRGSSGSPGFDMNGKIVILHAQGYDLEVEKKKYSLMEFGINFGAICADLEVRFHIANHFFPNWSLQDDVGLMDVDGSDSDEL